MAIGMGFNYIVSAIHNMASFLKITQLLLIIKGIIMKKNKTNIKDRDFQERIKQISNLLHNLNSDFNVDFSFNYIERDDNNIFLSNDTLYSKDISSSSLNILINNQNLLKQRIDNITRLIQDGFMLGSDKVGNKFLVTDISYEKGEPPIYYSMNNIEGSTIKDISLINSFSIN